MALSISDPTPLDVTPSSRVRTWSALVRHRGKSYWAADQRYQVRAATAYTAAARAAALYLRFHGRRSHVYGLVVQVERLLLSRAERHG